MHALLNYNSEITGIKRKRNERTNGQYNLKVRKIRKTEESKDQQEDNSLNQDEKKDWDEPIDEENDNEIAGSTVDEEISNNWFGRTFGDIIRAYRFYVEMSFAVFTVGFDEYEKSFTKDH